MSASTSRGVHLFVSGRVQGVGFRHFLRKSAETHHVAGWVRNLRDGGVEAVLVGPPEAVQAVVDQCGQGPRGARVDELMTRAAFADERAAATHPVTVLDSP